MSSPACLYPETQALTPVLRSMLDCPDLQVVDRQPAVYASTFPMEVVTLRLPDGPRRLLLKYGGAHTDNVFGHRGGVPYEAAVYREILRHLDLPAPVFFGAHHDPSGETWLATEYLEGAERLELASNAEEAVVESARWIGAFHRAVHEEFRGRPPAFLQQYDADYYDGWLERAARFAADRYPWLETLRVRFTEVSTALLTAPATIIHGEYYPKNILVAGGPPMQCRGVATAAAGDSSPLQVYPIDWESAVLAPGEIDLASLTEGWGHETERACREAYCRARWPGGPPPHFERTLLAAGIYLLLRWTGDRHEWTIGEDAEWQFGEMHALCRRLAPRR